MTERTSNEVGLAVLGARATAGSGWVVRFKSPTDYASVLGVSTRFSEFSFSLPLSDVGAWTATFRADDPLWTTALPLGLTGSILDRECLVEFIDDGVVRFEGLLEDVQPTVVAEDYAPMVTLSGRHVLALLERGIVLPSGLPTPTSMSRSMSGPVMGSWYTLWEEAFTRGAASGGVTPTFDATDDSLGVAWVDSQTRDVPGGRNLLDLLGEFAQAAEAEWLPLVDRQLVVAAGTLGSVRSDEVMFAIGRHQLTHETATTRREVATHVYVQAGEGTIALASDAASATEWGRRELWVSSGTSGDASAASAVANATLRLQGDERTSRTVTVIYDAEGRRLFDDYGVGDWVGVETAAGDVAELRIVCVGVKVGSDGNATAELTFITRFEAIEIRVRRALERLGQGDSSASSAGSPITVVQAVSAVRLTDLVDIDSTPAAADGEFLRYDTGSATWAGETAVLDDLVDVDLSTPPTDGQALVYDDGAGTWKPASGASTTALYAIAFGTTVTLTNMPAAATELGGATTWRTLFDPTNHTDMRIVGTVSTVGAGTSKVYAEYTTDTTGATGWTAVTSCEISITSLGAVASAWVTIPAGAQGTDDVLWRLSTSGGNGSADPVVGLPRLEFRP